MRVTQVISDTNIGGGGKALLNYLAHCDREAFVPSVVLPCGSQLTPLVEKLGVPFIEISAMADQSFDKKAFAPLKKALKELKPDVVHTHGSLVGRMVATSLGKKVLYTKHCAFAPRGFKASAVGKALVSGLDRSLASGVIAVGHSAQENLVASGIASKRIHVLYNGVSALAPISQEERERLRSSYGFCDTDFVVGILARVEVYKGHDTLLEAVESLVKQGVPVKLLVAGDGSYLEEFKKKTLSLPPQTVYFTGFVSEVEKVLGCMDVQVNASFESETSCLSLLEGMSLGLPAIASDCGGNPYLIAHGDNGLIFPKQESKALAEVILRLKEDKNLYSTLEQGSKTRFLAEFTGEQYARNMEEVYQSLA